MRFLFSSSLFSKHRYGMCNNRRPGFVDNGCEQSDMLGHFHPPLYRDDKGVAEDARVDEIGDDSFLHGQHFHPGLSYVSPMFSNGLNHRGCQIKCVRLTSTLGCSQRCLLLVFLFSQVL